MKYIVYGFVTIMSDVCHSCKKRAASLRYHGSGRLVCSPCFSQEFERHFVRSIGRESMLRPMGRILVGISGSTSSLALSYLLEKSERHLPNVKLIHVHLDRWHDDAEEEIISTFHRKYLSSELKVFKIESLCDLWENKALSGSISGTPNLRCMNCKSITRRAIFKAARRIGVQYVSLGETLDEYLSEKLLRIWLAGQSRNLSSFFHDKNVFGLKLSRPLSFSLGEEVKLYMQAKEIETNFFSCPFEDGIRKSLVRAVNNIEAKSPGILSSFRSLA